MGSARSHHNRIELARRISFQPLSFSLTRHGPAVVVVALLALLLHRIPAACGQPVAESQKPALQAIMNAWGGALPLNQSWFVASTCAQWLGLTCNAMGQVTALEMSGRRQLAGQSIPAAVTALSSLQRLSLDHNLLVGSIPADIGFLTTLTNLSLSGNALQGSIPLSTSALTALRTLDLSNNFFVGPIPNSFSALSSLSILALNANHLSGSLPSSLFSLTSLHALLLGGNWINGTLPTLVGNLKALVALDISDNDFYGYMPMALGTLTALAFLDVGSNQFTGSPLLSFSSPSMGNAALATYDTSNNFFRGPENASPAFSAPNGASLCPSDLQGRYAVTALGMFGASRHSSQKGNCYVGSAWNVTESFADGKGWSNKRLNGGKSGVGSSSSSTGSTSTNTSAGSSAATTCSVGSQRRAIECVSFCGAALPAGPCGGLGTCVLSGPSRTAACLCHEGVFRVMLTVRVGRETVTYPSCSTAVGTPPTPPPPPPDTATMRRREFRGANLDGSALPKSSYLNKFFRHASVGFTGNYSAPRWTIEPMVDWRARVPTALLGAKDQGQCSSCWIMAPVAATEALYSIVYSQSPPNISEQKAIDCQGTWKCAGGKPDDAFNYMASSGGLPTSASYPYTGAYSNATTCRVSRKRLLTSRRSLPSLHSNGSPSHMASSSSSSSSLHSPPSITQRISRLLSTSVFRAAANQKVTKPAALPPAPFPISMFESVGISGWLGLALAVQNQPVVVYIEARAESFMAYPGGFVYSDPLCFSTRVVDHLVLVVGFNLLDATPHWVIRNSWGPSWGESGYMRIAVAGGPGVCGMTSMPGLYPVLLTPDPCKPNPCGGGRCTPMVGNKNQRNKCSCPNNFVAVTNFDKSQSCAIAKVCAFFVMNPCGFGTCVDNNRGGYNCLCSVGYNLGARTDGSATCIPGDLMVKVTLQAPMSCGQVRSTYQISKADFVKLNPTLKCAGTFPPSTVIVTRNGTATATANVTGCVVPYSVAQGDTCASITSVFNITLTELTALNPDLECAMLVPGQQVCIRSGSPQPQSCLNFYVVNPGETCSDIMINTYPPITAAQLYQYNPGIICSADASSQRLAGQEVCVEAAVVGAVRCAYGTYVVVRGDTCGGVTCKIFRCSSSLMRTYNPSFYCTSSSLWVGKVLCKPKPL